MFSMKKHLFLPFLALIPVATALVFTTSSCSAADQVHPFDITIKDYENNQPLLKCNTTKSSFAKLLCGDKSYYAGNYLMLIANSWSNLTLNSFLFGNSSTIEDSSPPSLKNSSPFKTSFFDNFYDPVTEKYGLKDIGISLYYELDRFVDEFKIKDSPRPAATPFDK
jgi:hypothetical protein